MNTEIITVSANPTKLVNKQLAKATDSIYKIAMGIKRNLYEIAYIISTVDESKCYEQDGFESVHQWTEKSFGFKKSMSYSLLKIGKEYTRVIKDNKTGRVTGYTSNLLPSAFDRDDFTTTQVEAMLPLGYDKAKEAVDAEQITPDMSARDIKKYVKSLRHSDDKNSEQDDSAVDNAESSDGTAMDMEDYSGEREAIICQGTTGIVLILCEMLNVGDNEKVKNKIQDDVKQFVDTEIANYSKYIKC